MRRARSVWCASGPDARARDAARAVHTAPSSGEAEPLFVHAEPSSGSAGPPSVHAEPSSGSAGPLSVRVAGALGSALSSMAVALLASLACVSPARAAFEIVWQDARAAGLSAFVPSRDLGPALAPVDHEKPGRWVLTASACELFGLPEARGFRAAIERRGGIEVAVELGRFGSPVYQERVLSARASFLTGAGVRMDLRARALGLSARGVGEHWSAAADAAVRTTLLERLTLACRWDNLGGSSIRGSPISSCAGLSASLAVERLLLVASALVETGLEPSRSLGVEFEALPGLRFRAGAGTRPGTFSAGVGVRLPDGVPGAGGCIVDAAWRWHPELGVSSFVSISISR